MLRVLSWDWKDGGKNGDDGTQIHKAETVGVKLGKKKKKNGVIA